MRLFCKAEDLEPEGLDSNEGAFLACSQLQLDPQHQTIPRTPLRMSPKLKISQKLIRQEILGPKGAVRKGPMGSVEGPNYGYERPPPQRQ